jgi:hypothetical protein
MNAEVSGATGCTHISPTAQGETDHETDHCFGGVTLDGYFADPHGEIACQTLDDEFNTYSLEFLDSVDSLLFGRVTYELMKAWWPTSAGEAYSSELARRMNSATKFVVSRKTVDLSWSNSHRLEGDLPVAVHGRLTRQCTPPRDGPDSETEETMIARIWRGAVRTEDADEYATYVRNTGIEHYRSTPGNAGTNLPTF